MPRMRIPMSDEMFEDCLHRWKTVQHGKSYWPALAEKYKEDLLHAFDKSDSETLRAWFKRERKERDVHDKKQSYKGYHNFEFRKRDDGTYTSDRLIEIFEGDLNDDRKLLLAHNLDPEKWVIIDSISNMWHQQRPNDAGRLLQFQSKIRVKLKEIWDVSIDDVGEFYRAHEFATSSIKPKKYPKQSVRRVLEICLADWHIGARWYNKNLSDLEELFPNMMLDILQLAKKTELSEIWLIPGGDIFHFQNRQQQTDRNQQVVDGNGMNPLEMYDQAKRMFTWAIDACLEIAPVKIRYIPGNHDGIILYTLLCDLQSYYRNNEHYISDLSHTVHKWELFGKNLIAWEHGEKPKTNQIHWLPNEAASEWGKSLYREVHYFHWHHEEAKEHGGLKRRGLPALAPTDYWHHSKGYNGAIRALMAYVWEEDVIGYRQNWQSTGIKI